MNFKPKGDVEKLGHSLELDQVNVGPLVVLEWLDSAQPVASWVMKDEVCDAEWDICRCRSVGWLLHQDPELTILAPNLGDDGHQLSGVIRIPTIAITAQARIRNFVALDIPDPVSRGTDGC